MKKIAVKIIVFLFVIFLLSLLIYLYIYNLKDPCSNKFVNQWALCNHGQKIKDQDGLKGIDINIIKAWELTKGSPDVTVGILDSGIEIDNLNIKNNIYRNIKEKINENDDDQNGFIDDINGWNFYLNNNSVFDSYLHDYHGTYLSGIIAASHDTGKLYGIAPNVKIMPLKFLSGSQGQTEDAIKAIDYAHKMGVRIINCSWDNTTYNKELEEAMRTYKDILFICSTGKNSKDLNKVPVYPACYNLPNVVSVAAIDNRGELYRLSGFGQKAHVAAPGVNIYSCMPEGDYIYSSGTSPATAIVSGIAALIKSYQPTLTSVEIAEILKKSVTPIEGLEGKVASGGIIDAYKCLKNATTK